MEKVLHITNGGSLTKYLRELGIKDPILSWEEMLCEGPADFFIETREFYKKRKFFLSNTYDIEIDLKAYFNEINKLNNPEQYDHIVLWFEYDLFCHINMLAVINLLQQRNISNPIYLVCSGRVEGESNLKGLAELSKSQLLEHYKNKIQLKKDDIDLAKTLWGIYCGQDHNQFKPYIVQQSSFEYLGSCLKAHLVRFPDSVNGLGTIETNVLKLLGEFKIESKHHLVGYALNYQGYYGYGDLQYERVIGNLEPFMVETKDRLVLNDIGQMVLDGKENANKYITNTVVYGGVKRADFVFDKKENKLKPNQ
jgi:hypothetical protein